MQECNIRWFFFTGLKIGILLYIYYTIILYTFFTLEMENIIVRFFDT